MDTSRWKLREATIPMHSPTKRCRHVSERIQLVEVCPRDGLQNEIATLPTSTKIALIERLIAAGCTRIEATSFVSPKAIPQLADADDLFAGISVPGHVELIALVPNERGLRSGGGRGLSIGRGVHCGNRRVL